MNMENNLPDNYGSNRDSLGRWSQGNGGRPVGSKNRARRELIRFVETNVADLQKEYDLLEAKDKLKFLQSVLGFVIPRLQAETDSEGNDVEPKVSINYAELSPELLKELLNNTTINTNEDETN